MNYPLKQRRRPSRVMRVLLSKEVVAVMMLTVIALLTWALVQDRGILVPYRDKAITQLKTTPVYNQDELQSDSIAMDDMH